MIISIFGISGYILEVNTFLTLILSCIFYPSSLPLSLTLYFGRSVENVLPFCDKTQKEMRHIVSFTPFRPWFLEIVTET